VEPGVDDELRARRAVAHSPHQLGAPLVGQIDADHRDVRVTLDDHLLATGSGGRAAEHVEAAPFEEHREPVAQRFALLDQN
jgi:hypothetical protein